MRVLNLVIDDRSLSYDAVGVMGIVEADFEDVDDEFRRQYAYSIGLWHTANTLYFDPDEARWMSASDWQRSMVEQYTGGRGHSALSGFAWLVLLAVLIILVLWLTLRAHRQLNRTNAAQDKVLAEQERVIRLSEQAIEISRDSNRVLKEIRDSLNSSDS